MKRIALPKKVNRAMVIAFFACFIMILILVGVVFYETARTNQKKVLNITHDYVHFEDHVQSFLINNSNLMIGFSAYIQTFENYKEKDVYAYLGYLVDSNIYYIRNIGIIKGTTIIWNFPKAGNEKAIGTDLSTIPAQAAAIERAKHTLKYNFEGPVNLVQGGTGFIMRIPIIKNGKYWGMVSVVLKADKVKEVFDNYAKECNIKVAILNKSSNNSLIYGDKSVLNQNPIMFNSTFTGGEWTVYAIASDSTTNTDTGFLAFIIVMGIFLTIWVSQRTYKFFQYNEEIERKNATLNISVMKDKLTGIYNRNYLDSRIAEEIEFANRHVSPLSIIFFDLDHFKVVNDTYGHGYGDAVLKEVAAVVNGYIRSSDIFARWGGEEFAILMPATTLQGAVTAGEKLRAAVEAIEHPVVGRVTASFGVANYFTDEYTGSWFNRVDKALYVAKENGRNTVFAYENSSTDISVQVKIKWHEEWACGNEAIDKDHLELLNLGNLLMESSYNISTRETLIENVNRFLNHVTKHFENEEAILKRAGYKQLDEHIAAHRQLIKKTMELKDKLEGNKVDSQELFHYLLNEVVIGHIVKEDTKFFSYFTK
jgi:diguanylate cyclase (GGDEF)-like protein/hemerythrin-like metal-binding protein